MFESFLDFRGIRIRINQIATFCKPDGIVQIRDLDFSADAFCSLAPFEFNDHFVAVFIDNILSHAVAGCLAAMHDSTLHRWLVDLPGADPRAGTTRTAPPPGGRFAGFPRLIFSRLGAP